jgi:hypothetical protein
MKILLALLRALALVALTFITFAIAALTLGWVSNGRIVVANWVSLLFLVLAMLFLPVLGLRISWRAICLWALFVVPIAVYLAWDDPPVATSLEIAALAPPPSRAAESHAVALWYTTEPRRPRPKDWWLTPARNYLTPDLQPAEWRVFLVANRDTLRADWMAAASAREWVAALDAFEVIGDATASSDEPQLDFRALRATCFLHCAYASLLAIEGRGDEAVAVLRPMLSVGRKLQPAARGVTRLSTGIVCQHACQNAAQFILQSAAPTPDVLRLLGTSLAPGTDLAANYRRVFLCECALQVATISGDSRWTASLAEPVWMLVYNRNATCNLAVRNCERLLAVVMEGRGEGIRGHEQATRSDMRRTPFKNVKGQWWVSQVRADYFTRTVAASLAAEDDRRALLAEVLARLAAAEKKEPAAK